MRTRLAVGEKPLDWIGSAKEDFLAFPLRVQREIGNALGLAQIRRQASEGQALEG